MSPASATALAECFAALLEADPHLANAVERLSGRREPLLKTEEVALRLGVEDPTVTAMARDGRLPGHRVGREWRFLWSEVHDAVTSGRLASGGQG